MTRTLKDLWLFSWHFASGHAFAQDSVYDAGGPFARRYGDGRLTDGATFMLAERDFVITNLPGCSSDRAHFER